MKKKVICLVLTGAFAFAIKLTFAQDVKPINEDDSFTINQEAWGNSDAKDMLANMQGNADVTLMPFVPQENSDNAVSGPGN